ncbi:hypothetical protein OROGR_020610 [Orobanche gracilis]
MEISSFRSMAEFGMDDPILSYHHWPTSNPHVELSTESIASLIYEDFHHHTLSQQQQPILDFKRAAPESSGSWSNRPPKQLKTTTWGSTLTDTTTSEIVNPNEENTIWSSYNTLLDLPSESVASFGNHNNYVVKKPCQGTKRLTSTTPQDHILAERKRREKISQRFIALSALVPGLKKMDKASVLGDAVKYLKQLQEKNNILEEQTKTKSMEKFFLVRKYEVYADDGENSSSEENFFNVAPTVTESLPEIQARICDKDVLIIINCEKRKGVLGKAVAEIEKLNLSVFNSCMMSYGDSALSMTLLAKKDEKFPTNMKELVNNLRRALKK